MNLPPGFVLDDEPKKQPAEHGLPAGFVLDEHPDAKAQAPEPQAEQPSPYAGALGGILAGLDSAGNTLAFNVPRNLAAGLRSLKNGSSFDQEYDYLKKVGEEAAAAHPIISGVGTAAGALGSLAVMPEAAPTMMGRAAQAAKWGAGMAGASELADSKDLGKAATAAALGGVLGGAAGPVVEGAAQVVGKVAQPVMGYARGAINADDEAARRVAAAIARDQEIGGAGFTPDQLRGALDKNNPAILGDMGGETTRALARDAANTSPEGRFALNEAISPRYDTQAERLAQTADEMSSGVSNFEKRQQLEALAREQNNANYGRFRAMTQGGVWTPDLEQATASPAVQDAIRKTLETSREAAVARGQKVAESPFVRGADGTYTIARRADGTEIKPTGEFWDHVQRNMSSAANKAASYGEGDKFGAGLINETRKKITGHLDELTTVNGESVYNTARTGAAKAFGAGDAIEAGEKYFSHKGTAQELSNAVGKFKGAEKELFHDSVAQAVAKKLRVDVADRQNAINALFKNEEGRKKLLIGLGSKERMDKLEAQLHIERVMDAMRPAVQGNSTTARQLAEMGLAGGIGGSGYVTGSDTATMGGIGLFAASLAKHRIDANLARKVGELIASRDPANIAKVEKMLVKNPRMMDAFRKVEPQGGAIVGRGLGDALGGN